MEQVKDKITLAVSKGRILEESLPLLARAGLSPREDPNAERKLIFQTDWPGAMLIIIRAADVPVYVAHGGADLGIAGKDALTEYDSDNLYEPLDLKIARCRMMVAGAEGRPRAPGPSAHRDKVCQDHPGVFRRQGRTSGSDQAVRLHGAGPRAGPGGPDR